MLAHIINIENPPHAILINESKLCDIDELIKQYKTKLKTNDTSCFIELDGYTQTIKKEDIQNIIENFNLSPYGNSNKLYIIRGIENTSQQAINSLLKFLEEPPLNTYALITTRNINNVLVTIKSRCQLFTLTSNFKKLDEISNSYSLSSEQIDIIKMIYYDWKTLNQDLESKLFFKYYEDAKKLVTNPSDPQIIKDKSDEFKKMTYPQILLLLNIVNYFVKPNIELLKLIDSLKVTPSRLMIFNHLWIILENNIKTWNR